jgi:hypothetical protein
MKRPLLGGPVCRWGGNIINNLKEVDGIYLAQDTGQYQALENSVMNSGSDKRHGIC